MLDKIKTRIIQFYLFPISAILFFTLAIFGQRKNKAAREFVFAYTPFLSHLFWLLFTFLVWILKGLKAV